nr:eosinophil peroxidase-like [Zootoca vivipara]
MPGLTALHTLFMRFHNRMASQLKMLNPQMDGDTVYNTARKITGAVIQKITYTEYLPALLGDAFARFVGHSTGYNDSVDPRIASSFTNAFRFGHASVRPVVFRLDSRYQLQSETPLEKEFFASWRIVQQGMSLLGKAKKRRAKGRANFWGPEIRKRSWGPTILHSFYVILNKII